MESEDSEEVVMSLVGERLRAERKRLGLSQKALGELCDVSSRAVIAWESGVKIPSHKLSAVIQAGGDANFILTGQRTSETAPGQEHLSEVSTREKCLDNNEMAVSDATDSFGRLRPKLEGSFGRDKEALRWAIETLEQGLQETGREMAPELKAEAILALVELYVDSDKADRGVVLRLIKSVSG